MSQQHIWLGGVAALLAGLAGCSAKVDPKNDCIKEFIQDFVLDEQEGSHHSYNRPCPGQDLEGPPHWPYARRTVHLEYSDGDYYIVQTLRQWSWEQNRATGCDDKLRIEERVTRLSSLGGKEMINATRDGMFVDDRDVREYYRPSLVYALKSSTAPDREHFAITLIEKSAFGIDCLMVDEPIGASERRSHGCRPIAPAPQCLAFDRMMPIHQEGYFGNTAVTGRTTSFKFAKVGKLVDKSKWMAQ